MRFSSKEEMLQFLHKKNNEVKSLGGDVSKWAKSGFQTVSEEDLVSRLEICKGCEFWDADGFAGTGRCQKCGCSTQAKLRMATSSCPLTPPKWGPVS